MNKNNSISIWRIFFAYVIAAFHFLNAYGYSTSLYLATDFFFIVSGYLLAYEIESDKWKSSYDMLFSKIKKYYPHYIFSLLVALSLSLFLGKGPEIKNKSLLLEVFMLQMSGMNLTTLINVPTWYLSVLLISSFIYYYIYKNYKKALIEFVIPMFLLIVGAWFYRTYGCLSHSTLGNDITIGVWWNRPLLIGCGMMGIGILIFNYQNNRKHVRGGGEQLKLY